MSLKPAAGVDALYAPRRTLLDRLLVDAARGAGASIRFGTTVKAVLRDGDGRVAGVSGRDGGGREFVARAPGPLAIVPLEDRYTRTGSDLPPSTLAAARKPPRTASACLANAGEASGNSNAMCGTSPAPASAGCGLSVRAEAGTSDFRAGDDVGSSGTGFSRAGGCAAGEVAADSLANAGVPPYSTAAARGTTSQRWSTPQRMRESGEDRERHYM